MQNEDFENKFRLNIYFPDSSLSLVVVLYNK